MSSAALDADNTNYVTANFKQKKKKNPNRAKISAEVGTSLALPNLRRAPGFCVGTCAVQARLHEAY